MEQKDLMALYEKIIENYYGTILVLDKKGKVVYANENVVQNTKGITYQELLNSNMEDLVRRGFWQHSPSLRALRLGKPVTEYLEGNVRHPLMTTSIPVYDGSGALEYVIAYSQGMNYVDDMLRKLSEERNRLDNIISFTNTLSGNGQIVAESRAMKELFSILKTVSYSSSTILILGESGTGKEVVARYIHKNSSRRDRLFLPINCAVFPPELIEAELFGYERGAFTGASREGKTGLFELANGGTLFLDEIGELPLSVQSKLLRVLENGEIRKIGGSTIKAIDARIIAATNRNLLDMVKKNQFREDLYYRLNVIPVSLPPLRERREDIFPLCCHFLNELNAKYGKRKQLDGSVRQLLEGYPWPGNVREVRNVIERLFVITPFESITASDIPQVLLQNGPSEEARQEEREAPPADLPWEGLYQKKYREAMREFERLYLARALERSGGNVTEAAKRIQLSRSMFYHKLQNKTPGPPRKS
ncbi:MAG: sigma 54-interacting transcriptional regulator [Oscillospiraceae bacterium]|nr:sigma 54-interacting transcriptional regulator [Oscillospiraceae bacterium]